ncbi:aminotransferase class IV [Dinghuibacter silviterrae]|uniref:aminotransferase class IV n=1 Tax=Dinghuibacter silviterrae TaxID=1539049 RepID=UPI0013C2CE0A|nr:aminotransferase class IV [Dinghuibacter silviterrae]
MLYDREFYPTDTPLAGGGSRGLRYGDGLFETIKVAGGRVLLWHYHVERLWHGLTTLGFDLRCTPSMLEADVLDLCARNGHSALARVRLNVFRGEGLSDCHCIIETFPLVLEDRALEIGVYPDGRKAFDVFANLKSNNYLVYVRAADWARAQGLDECLVLNAYGRVADAATSNVFWVRSGEIFTPPLSEAGVAGVTRRYLVERFPIREQPVSPADLMTAEEVFLTNAIRGVRWVTRFGAATYGRSVSIELAKSLER